MAKYLSETIKKGEPEDHSLGVDISVQFLNLNRKKKSYHAERDWHIRYPEGFRKFKKFKPGEFLDHEADAVILEEIQDHVFTVKAYIELDGNLDFWSTYLGKKIHVTKTRHSKKNQQKNDGIFQDYVSMYLFDVEVIRLDKTEIFGDEDARVNHLTEKFKKYIK